MKEKYSVESINTKETYEWLLHKHYAKRIPSISYAFGLYEDDSLIGVCTYGRPVAHKLIQNALSGTHQDNFLELNRLCVNESLEKNALSYFVSSTIKLIPSPKVLVSYADTSQNHNGYIYQATNWIYTGLSAKFKDYMVKGYEHMHGASVLDMVGRSDGDKGHLNKVELLKAKFGEDNVYLIDRPRKHRYFYFIGSKKQKKEMLKKLIYKIEPYPKGENKRYDASYKPQVQAKLF
jgi:hypothetical protein